MAGDKGLIFSDIYYYTCYTDWLLEGVLEDRRPRRGNSTIYITLIYLIKSIVSIVIRALRVIVLGRPDYT